MSEIGSRLPRQLGENYKTKVHRWLMQRMTRLHPTYIILYSYIFGIALGTLLLVLPISTVSGQIPVMDAIFTATSAVCVTGLIVVDTESYFTAFGQGVILALIQLGGLGIMTFSVAIYRLIGRQISFHQRMMMQDIFTHTPTANVFQILKSIFLFTLIVEALGAFVLFLFWMQSHPVGEALYLATFHSISAFCNAGFALFSDNLISFQDNWLINLTIGSLIIMGGIGFPVVFDIYQTLRHRAGRKRKLLAQTKVVLVTSAILTVGGGLLFWFLERGNILAGMPMDKAFLISLFQSVASRTAGFNTVDLGQMSVTTMALMIFLMFVGASPGSTGGGIKTTTLALLCAFAWSRLRHQRYVNLFKKTVPGDTLTKGIMLVLLSIVLINVVFFLIMASLPYADLARDMHYDRFLSALFETVSAFSTVGLSLGITPELTDLAKFWVIVMMLIGRVGILTIVYIVVGPTPAKGREYAEENIMVG